MATSRRTKSFKNWYAQMIDGPKAECAQRIVSKRTNIDRWRKKFLEVKGSKIGTVEGMPRVDFLNLCEREIRKYTNEEAREKKNLKEIEDSISNSDTLRNKLKEHPSIEDAIVTREDRLKVFTKPLISGRSKIGAFSITYYPKSKNIKIANLTYSNTRRPNLDHWAVNDGSPCLGDWADGMMALMKSFSVYLLMDSVIRYLCTAGDRSAYCQKAEWLEYKVPKKKEDQPEVDPDEVADEAVAGLVTAQVGPEITASVLDQTMRRFQEAINEIHR